MWINQPEGNEASMTWFSRVFKAERRDAMLAAETSVNTRYLTDVWLIGKLTRHLEMQAYVLS